MTNKPLYRSDLGVINAEDTGSPELTQDAEEGTDYDAGSLGLESPKDSRTASVVASVSFLKDALKRKMRLWQTHSPTNTSTLDGRRNA